MSSPDVSLPANQILDFCLISVENRWSWKFQPETSNAIVWCMLRYFLSEGDKTSYNLQNCDSDDEVSEDETSNELKSGEILYSIRVPTPSLYTRRAQLHSWVGSSVTGDRIMSIMAPIAWGRSKLSALSSLKAPMQRGGLAYDMAFLCR